MADPLVGYVDRPPSPIETYGFLQEDMGTPALNPLESPVVLPEPPPALDTSLLAVGWSRESSPPPSQAAVLPVLEEPPAAPSTVVEEAVDDDEPPAYDTVDPVAQLMHKIHELREDQQAKEKAIEENSVRLQEQEDTLDFIARETERISSDRQTVQVQQLGLESAKALFHQEKEEWKAKALMDVTKHTELIAKTREVEMLRATVQRLTEDMVPLKANLQHSLKEVANFQQTQDTTVRSYDNQIAVLEQRLKRREEDEAKLHELNDSLVAQQRKDKEARAAAEKKQLEMETKARKALASADAATTALKVAKTKCQGDVDEITSRMIKVAEDAEHYRRERDKQRKEKEEYRRLADQRRGDSSEVSSLTKKLRAAEELQRETVEALEKQTLRAETSRVELLDQKTRVRELELEVRVRDVRIREHAATAGGTQPKLVQAEAKCREYEKTIADATWEKKELLRRLSIAELQLQEIGNLRHQAASSASTTATTSPPDYASMFEPPEKRWKPNPLPSTVLPAYDPPLWSSS